MANPSTEVMPAVAQLEAEKEMLVVQLLSEAVELLELIAERLPRRGAGYYIQCLFLVLRQMGYFFTEKSSPLKSQVGALSGPEQDVAERIKTIRDAIGHRESKDNFLNPNIKLIGGMNFRDGDVEVQFGPTKLKMLDEIVANHRRYREMFRSAAELVDLSRHPMWERDEASLAAVEAVLAEKLSEPHKLLEEFKT